MTSDPKSIALGYIDACGQRDHETVARLLAPDLVVYGPARTIHGASEYVAALRRLGAVWVRSEVKKAFADGGDVCVVYDFVSDTPAGAVPCVEWLRIEDGRIRSIHLLYDRVTFQPAADEVARRAVRAAG